jgi:hypothetical protein
MFTNTFWNFAVHHANEVEAGLTFGTCVIGRARRKTPTMHTLLKTVRRGTKIPRVEVIVGVAVPVHAHGVACTAKRGTRETQPHGVDAKPPPILGRPGCH